MAYTSLKLPRLPLNWDKQPQLFERYWDEAMSSIEKSINGILSLPEIQAAIDAANLAATNANMAAGAAQSTADAQKSANSLINSYINSASFTAPLIAATSAGSVTIKTHQRVYGDTTLNPSRTVNGATISTTGASGNTIRVYYNDATRAGGTVSYLYTIDPAPAPVQMGNVHSVGVVVVPLAGSQDGNFVRGPGYVEAP